ncbi:MAG: hypothetical protein ACW981_05085 [Candidatus Hodarchaeales archaeon]|jgi:hypothetical protein
MADLTFTIIDPTLGPLVAFTTSEESFAKKIAIKSQISLTMSKNDFNVQDAVLPFPDLGKIGFIFLFKIYGKGGPVIASISYVVDQDLQMDLYKKIPVLKRKAQMFAYRFSDFEYEGKAVLPRDQAVFLQNLFSSVSIFQSELQKQAIKTKMQKSDVNWLLRKIGKDLDQAVFSLLLDQPVVIIGHRVNIEQVMGSLEVFTPWKIPLKLMDITNAVDPTGFDLIGCQNEDLADYFVKNGIAVININDEKTFGGISNRYLQSIIEDLKRPWDSTSAERFIKSEFEIYNNTINQFTNHASKIPVNMDKILEELSNLEEKTKNLVISIAKIKYPNFQNIFEQISDVKSRI